MGFCKVSSHGCKEWVFALSACSLEVVHGNVPDHTASESLLLDVVHLVLDGLETVVSNPLVTLVGVGSNSAFVSLYLSPSLVLQIQTDLVVSEESLGSGPDSSLTTVPSGSSNPILGGILQGEGTSVNRETKDNLPSRESTLNPVVYSGINVEEGDGISLTLVHGCVMS